MNLNRRNIEKLLFIGTALILIYLGLQNMNIVVEFFVWVLGVLTPFIIAVCCTFFLSVPLKAIEKRLFQPNGDKPVKPILEKIRRPVSIILSIALFLLIIGAFLIVIIPEILSSINDIAHAMPDALKSLNENIKQLLDLNLRGKNENVRMKIMGLEGSASNHYWNGVKYFIPKEIGFESRTKKPTDLMNSMLNYGYAILASEITKSILTNGLDPYCGFLHFDMYGRASLTFDLIEPFRQQIVDKTVIALINRKQITTKDLDNRNNLIKLEARKLIVESILSKVYSTITYDNETVSYSDLIEKQSKNLVNVLLDNGKFNGFYLRW